MKLSILTTITNPEERQDPWQEALTCYCDLADEIIVVNGGDEIHPKTFGQLAKERADIKELFLPWPYEWSFEELPKHLNAGLEEATGDWVLKLDIDQLIHEENFAEVRDRLGGMYAPVVTFQKMSILPNRKFIQKGEMIVAINKKNYPNICFGEAEDTETDLCKPIYKQGINDKDIPYGSLVAYEEAGRTGVSLWNFDYTFKTQEFTRKEFFRFSRAYNRYFDTWPWGSTEEEAFDIFIKMMKGRLEDAKYQITNLSVLPKYIRERYANLTSEQFGFNGWGLL